MNNNASLGGLLALISNPAVLAVVGIGAVVLTVIEMFSEDDDKQDNGSEPVSCGPIPFTEPLKTADLTVPATVIEPFETVDATVENTVHSSVEDWHAAAGVDNGIDHLHQVEIVSEEAAKKELIRQAMSELGKRSAAARAKKASGTL